MDYLQFIFQAINNLLTQNLGFFDAMGQNLFRSFATILVVWYGVKSALSSASGKHFLHFDNFASLLLTISFGFGMVNYYSAPIPGIGTSFHNLITDESQFLANKINQTELQTVEERIADFEIRMDSPGIADVLGTVIYVVIIILLAAAQAIAIVVIAFGFIATAVCVLVGPVFIPFFIVPKSPLPSFMSSQISFSESWTFNRRALFQPSNSWKLSLSSLLRSLPQFTRS